VWFLGCGGLSKVRKAKPLATFSLWPQAQRKSYQKETPFLGLRAQTAPPFEKGGPKLYPQNERSRYDGK
jgi:hypothetical protein